MSGLVVCPVSGMWCESQFLPVISLYCSHALQVPPCLPRNSSPCQERGCWNLERPNFKVCRTTLKTRRETQQHISNSRCWIPATSPRRTHGLKLGVAERGAELGAQCGNDRLWSTTPHACGPANTDRVQWRVELYSMYSFSIYSFKIDSFHGAKQGKTRHWARDPPTIARTGNSTDWHWRFTILWRSQCSFDYVAHVQETWLGICMEHSCNTCSTLAIHAALFNTYSTLQYTEHSYNTCSTLAMLAALFKTCSTLTMHHDAALLNTRSTLTIHAALLQCMQHSSRRAALLQYIRMQHSSIHGPLSNLQYMDHSWCISWCI